jgi:hypothetical protein
MIDISTRIDALVEVCARDAARGLDWRRRALEEHVRTVLDAIAPATLLEWARDDKRWTLTLAEAADEVCAKPREAAAYLLMKIVEELLEERGLITD